MSQRLRSIFDVAISTLTILASVCIVLCTVLIGWTMFANRTTANMNSGAVTQPALPGSSNSRPSSVVEVPSIVTKIGRAAVNGTNAKVAIIEFSDFQCPFCGKYARDTYPKLLRDYVKTGLVSYTFRHFPLEIHKFAEGAGEAAECAGVQGKFWEMHDLLFASQDHLDPPSLLANGVTLGLNQGYRLCVQQQATRRSLVEDKTEAARFDIHGTPTFVLGEARPGDSIVVLRKISGAQPYEVFKKTIDELLNSKLVATR
jgi:protein-disulfide isomerase